MESYVIARPKRQIENGKHAKYSDKKGIPEFRRIFFCCRCGYIMHVSCMKIVEFKALQFGTKNLKISKM